MTGRERLSALASWFKHLPGRVWRGVTRIAVGLWRRVLRPLVLLLPHLPYVLVLNRRIRSAFQPKVDTAWETVAEVHAVDLDAAIALWQFETDRLNGLAAKGAAVLAADAIIATGIATQAASSGVVAFLCVASLLYLVSAVGGVFLVQKPQARFVVQAEHVLNGTAAREMVAANIANTSEGIAVQNLVYVGVRDTMISLILFIAALAVKFAC